MNIKGNCLKNIKNNIGNKLILISFAIMILGNLLFKEYELPIAINLLLFSIIFLASIINFFISYDKCISILIGGVCLFLVFYFWFFSILANSSFLNYRGDILFKSIPPKPIRVELKKISAENEIFTRKPIDEDIFQLEQPNHQIIIEKITINN